MEPTSEPRSANEPARLQSKLLKELVNGFAGKKIGVIGDIGVDRYTHGLVERISPEAPVPIVLVESEHLKLGIASNVADNVQALGGIPLLLGAVGEDRAAEDFYKLLDQLNISKKWIISDRTRRTVLKERIVSGSQQLLRVDYEHTHPLNLHARNSFLKNLVDICQEASVLIVEDYAKGLLDEELIQTTIKAASSRGVPVLVDPNEKTSLSCYKGAFLITPNRREAEKLTGRAITDDASLLEVGKILVNEIGAQFGVITLGKDGMAIFSRSESNCLKLPTYAREVYDVSGAGDTVVAVLALALASGADIPQAVTLANIAAGIEVSKLGTATVSPSELLALV